MSLQEHVDCSSQNDAEKAPEELSPTNENGGPCFNGDSSDIESSHLIDSPKAATSATDTNIVETNFLSQPTDNEEIIGTCLSAGPFSVPKKSGTGSLVHASLVLPRTFIPKSIFNFHHTDLLPINHPLNQNGNMPHLQYTSGYWYNKTMPPICTGALSKLGQFEFQADDGAGSSQRRFEHDFRNQMFPQPQGHPNITNASAWMSHCPMAQAARTEYQSPSMVNPKYVPVLRSGCVYYDQVSQWTPVQIDLGENQSLQVVKAWEENVQTLQTQHHVSSTTDPPVSEQLVDFDSGLYRAAYKTSEQVESFKNMFVWFTRLFYQWQSQSDDMEDLYHSTCELMVDFYFHLLKERHFYELQQPQTKAIEEDTQGSLSSNPIPVDSEKSPEMAEPTTPIRSRKAASFESPQRSPKTLTFKNHQISPEPTKSKSPQVSSKDATYTVPHEPQKDVTAKSPKESTTDVTVKSHTSANDVTFSLPVLSKDAQPKHVQKASNGMSRAKSAPEISSCHHQKATKTSLKKQERVSLHNALVAILPNTQETPSKCASKTDTPNLEEKFYKPPCQRVGWASPPPKKDRKENVSSDVHSTLMHTIFRPVTLPENSCEGVVNLSKPEWPLVYDIKSPEPYQMFYVVKFNKMPPVYEPSEHVSGFLALGVKENIACCGLRTRLRGTARVSVQEAERDSTLSVDYDFLTIEVNIEEKNTVYANNIVPRSFQELPFSFRLPDSNMVNHYKDQSVAVEYRLELMLVTCPNNLTDDALNWHRICETPWLLLSKIYIQGNQMIEPCYSYKPDKFERVLAIHDQNAELRSKVQVRGKLSRSVFAIGDIVYLTVTIKDIGKSLVDQISATIAPVLLQSVIIANNSIIKLHRIMDCALAEPKQCVLGSIEEKTLRFRLAIGDILPSTDIKTTTPCIGFFQVFYHLRVVFSVPGFDKPFHVLSQTIFIVENSQLHRKQVGAQNKKQFTPVQPEIDLVDMECPKGGPDRSIGNEELSPMEILAKQIQESKSSKVSFVEEKQRALDMIKDGLLCTLFYITELDFESDTTKPLSRKEELERRKADRKIARKAAQSVPSVDSSDPNIQILKNVVDETKLVVATREQRRILRKHLKNSMIRQLHHRHWLRESLYATKENRAIGKKAMRTWIVNTFEKSLFSTLSTYDNLVQKGSISYFGISRKQDECAFHVSAIDPRNGEDCSFSFKSYKTGENLSLRGDWILMIKLSLGILIDEYPDTNVEDILKIDNADKELCPSCADPSQTTCVMAVGEFQTSLEKDSDTAPPEQLSNRANLSEENGEGGAQYVYKPIFSDGMRQCISTMLQSMLDQTQNMYDTMAHYTPGYHNNNDGKEAPEVEGDCEEWEPKCQAEAVSPSLQDMYSEHLNTCKLESIIKELANCANGRSLNEPENSSRVDVKDKVDNADIENMGKKSPENQSEKLMRTENVSITRECSEWDSDEHNSTCQRDTLPGDEHPSCTVQNKSDKVQEIRVGSTKNSETANGGVKEIENNGGWTNREISLPAGKPDESNTITKHVANFNENRFRNVLEASDTDIICSEDESLQYKREVSHTEKNVLNTQVGDSGSLTMDSDPPMVSIKPVIKGDDDTKTCDQKEKNICSEKMNECEANEETEIFNMSRLTCVTQYGAMIARQFPEQTSSSATDTSNGSKTTDDLGCRENPTSVESLNTAQTQRVHKKKRGKDAKKRKGNNQVKCVCGEKLLEECHHKKSPHDNEETPQCLEDKEDGERNAKDINDSGSCKDLVELPDNFFRLSEKPTLDKENVDYPLKLGNLTSCDGELKTVSYTEVATNVLEPSIQEVLCVNIEKKNHPQIKTDSDIHCDAIPSLYTFGEPADNSELGIDLPETFKSVDGNLKQKQSEHFVRKNTDTDCSLTTESSFENGPFETNKSDGHLKQEKPKRLEQKIPESACPPENGLSIGNNISENNEMLDECLKQETTEKGAPKRHNKEITKGNSSGFGENIFEDMGMLDVCLDQERSEHIAFKHPNNPLSTEKILGFVKCSSPTKEILNGRITPKETEYSTHTHPENGKSTENSLDVVKNTSETDISDVCNRPEETENLAHNHTNSATFEGNTSGFEKNSSENRDRVDESFKSDTPENLSQDNFNNAIYTESSSGIANYPTEVLCEICKPRERESISPKHSNITLPAESSFGLLNGCLTQEDSENDVEKSPESKISNSVVYQQDAVDNEDPELETVVCAKYQADREDLHVIDSVIPNMQQSSLIEKCSIGDGLNCAANSAQTIETLSSANPTVVAARSQASIGKSVREKECLDKRTVTKAIEKFEQEIPEDMILNYGNIDISAIARAKDRLNSSKDNLLPEDNGETSKTQGKQLNKDVDAIEASESINEVLNPRSDCLGKKNEWNEAQPVKPKQNLKPVDSVSGNGKRRKIVAQIFKNPIANSTPGTGVSLQKTSTNTQEKLSGDQEKVSASSGSVPDSCKVLHQRTSPGNVGVMIPTGESLPEELTCDSLNHIPSTMIQNLNFKVAFEGNSDDGFLYKKEHENKSCKTHRSEKMNELRVTQINLNIADSPTVDCNENSRPDKTYIEPKVIDIADALSEQDFCNSVSDGTQFANSYQQADGLLNAYHSVAANSPALHSGPGGLVEYLVNCKETKETIAITEFKINNQVGSENNEDHSSHIDKLIKLSLSKIGISYDSMAIPQTEAVSQQEMDSSVITVPGVYYLHNVENEILYDGVDTTREKNLLNHNAYQSRYESDIYSPRTTRMSYSANFEESVQEGRFQEIHKRLPLSTKQHDSSAIFNYSSTQQQRENPAQYTNLKYSLDESTGRTYPELYGSSSNSNWGEGDFSIGSRMYSKTSQDMSIEQGLYQNSFSLHQSGCHHREITQRFIDRDRSLYSTTWRPEEEILLCGDHLLFPEDTKPNVPNLKNNFLTASSDLFLGNQQYDENQYMRRGALRPLSYIKPQGTNIKNMGLTRKYESDQGTSSVHQRVGRADLQKVQSNEMFMPQVERVVYHPEEKCSNLFPFDESKLLSEYATPKDSHVYLTENIESSLNERKYLGHPTVCRSQTRRQAAERTKPRNLQQNNLVTQEVSTDSSNDSVSTGPFYWQSNSLPGLYREESLRRGTNRYPTNSECFAQRPPSEWFSYFLGYQIEQQQPSDWNNVQPLETQVFPNLQGADAVQQLKRPERQSRARERCPPFKNRAREMQEMGRLLSMQQQTQQQRHWHQDGPTQQLPFQQEQLARQNRPGRQQQQQEQEENHQQQLQQPIRQRQHETVSPAIPERPNQMRNTKNFSRNAGRSFRNQAPRSQPFQLRHYLGSTQQKLIFQPQKVAQRHNTGPTHRKDQ